MQRITIEDIKKCPEAISYIKNNLNARQAEQLLKDWSIFARKEQLPPKGDWFIWLFLGGRGAGKTRTGAEWIRRKVMEGAKRIAFIGATAADVRDVMIEGESGILACCSDYDVDLKGNKMGVPIYEPSKRRLTWGNGAQVSAFSAEKPDRLRGPQHDTMWADEIAAWQYADAWNLAMFGLRLGEKPQVFVSTTPKPVKVLKDLIKNEGCTITRATTYDNKSNLAASFFKQIIRGYEGSPLGQQELMGEMLDAAETAFWDRERLNKSRLSRDQLNLNLVKIAIGVDPAVTAHENSDETGIIVAGIDQNNNGYILEDGSGKYKPLDWARKVVSLQKKWRVQTIIAEGNQGGDLVAANIRTVDPGAPVQIVRATRGKAARAEPVATLFYAERIFLLGNFPRLEEQMCTWEPYGKGASPDRVDAMVWVFTYLMIDSGVFFARKLNGFF